MSSRRWQKGNCVENYFIIEIIIGNNERKRKYEKCLVLMSFCAHKNIMKQFFDLFILMN